MFVHSSRAAPSPSTTSTMTGRTVNFTAAVAALPPGKFTVRNPYRFGSIRASEVPIPGSAIAMVITTTAPVNTAAVERLLLRGTRSGPSCGFRFR